jgi:hypothetical protein
MARHEQVVDEIRAFLESTNQTRSASAEELAKEYAEACLHANARLRQCADLLRRGLRAEAVHLAETEPNLLDLVAMLDMDEAAAWREICAAYEWPEAPALAMTSAAALNEAYADEAPLQNLASHLRVMALARAPLHERLVVMRKIAELDTTNSFWDDDVKLFERARVEEIREQIKAGTRANDAAAVGRLTEEIRSSPWRVAVPNDVHRTAEDAHRRLKHLKAEADLRQMLPVLREAYTAVNFDECQSLLAKWLAIVTEAQCTPATDLQQEVEPIFSWFKEEEQRKEHKSRFDAACDALEQAIDTDVPTPELERVYQATLRFQHEVPTELEDRYRGRLAARESAGRQRRELIYAGIAAAFLATAGTVIYYAYQSSLGHELNSALQVIQDAQNDVTSGNPKTGIELRKQLVDQHQRIIQNPQMIKALADFDNAVTAETQRETDFALHMEAAEKAGVQKPDQADLQQAETLAKTPAETQRVAALTDQLKEVSDKQQQENDSRFSADGAALATVIDSRLSDSILAKDPQGYAASLKELTDKANELRQRAGVSPLLHKAQISSLDAQLSQRQQAIGTWQTVSRLYDDVRHSGTNAAAHAAALKAYIDAVPDGPIPQAFSKAASMLDEEQAVEQWDAIYSPWRVSPIPQSSDDAKARVAKIGDYLKAHPKMPLLNSLNGYLAYLNQGIALTSDDGPWRKDFGKLLTNPLIHDLQCLETTDGTLYYVTGQVQVTPSELEGRLVGQGFQAVTSPDTDHPVKVELAASNLLKSTDAIPSPQAKFAVAAQDQIAALDFQKWDEIGFEMIDALRHSAGMHPVLEAILLQHILGINKPAAALINRPEYEKAAVLLATKDADDIAWMDPNNPVPQSTQNDLRQIADGLPDIASVRAALLAHRASIINACNVNLLGEGVLLQPQDGNDPNNWTLNSDAILPSGAVAYIIGTGGLVQIGHLIDGKWVLDGEKLPFVPNGTLVFITANAELSGAGN